MSRWAVLFRSLSTDTADTTDITRVDEVPPRQTEGSVRSVDCVLVDNAGTPDGAAHLLAAALEGGQALGVPDPALARERAEIASALAAETTGAFGPTPPPDQHSKAVAGLLRGFAAHSRPSGEGAPP